MRVWRILQFTLKKNRHPSGTVGEGENYIQEPSIDMNENTLLYCITNAEKYPEVVQLYEKYLAVPATSAPDEQLFLLVEKSSGLIVLTS